MFVLAWEQPIELKAIVADTLQSVSCVECDLRKK